jgi:hypothetical protein
VRVAIIDLFGAPLAMDTEETEIKYVKSAKDTEDYRQRIAQTAITQVGIW